LLRELKPSGVLVYQFVKIVKEPPYFGVVAAADVDVVVVLEVVVTAVVVEVVFVVTALEVVVVVVEVVVDLLQDDKTIAATNRMLNPSHRDLLFIIPPFL